MSTELRFRPVRFQVVGFTAGHALFVVYTERGESIRLISARKQRGRRGDFMKMRLNPKNPKKGRTDWARVEAMTDTDIERAARSDPGNKPLTEAELKKLRRVPEVKRIRQELGMTQEHFARVFQLSVATLRDWEQGRYPPDQSARTLLKVIAAMPREVRGVLGRA